MKQILLILSALVFVFTMYTAQAQLINPGFEVWTNDAIVPTAMNPNSGNNTYGWWDYNYFNSTMLGGSPISVIRCTDTVHTGNYSVRLETQVYTPTSWNIYKTWGYPFIGHEYNDTLGILFNGKVDVTISSFNPGIPFTQNLDQFKFYYQYSPNGNDTAECRVALLNAGTYIAGGVFKTAASTSGMGWQQAVIDFVYVSGLTPDTLYILMSSSSLDYEPQEGSVLWIDDVSIVESTGIEHKIWEENNIAIYPNPTSREFTLKMEITKPKAMQLKLFNLTGQLLLNENIELKTGTYTKTIDMGKYTKGMHTLQLITDEEIINRKIVVE